MTLLRHLLAADVRRLRLLLAVLVLLTLGGCALAIAQPLAATGRWMASLGAASTLAWIAKLMVTLLTVALIVQGHALVGSDAFWMTRPIPPLALLVSKALLLAIPIAALPAACELVLMSLYDVPGRQMALVLLQTVMFQVLWLTLLMCAASVTRHVAGFGAVAGAAVVAMAVFVLMLPLFLLDEDASEGMVFLSVGVSMPEPGGGNDILFVVLTIAAGVALLTVQYLTRSRWRSLLTGAAALALAWTVAWLWPWPMFAKEIQVPPWTSRPDALVLSGEPTTASFDDEPGWGARRWRFGRARLQLDGVEPGWTATARVIASTLTLEDGTRLQGRGFLYGEQVPIEAGEAVQHRSVMRRVLDVERIAAFGQPGQKGLVALVLPAADVQSHTGASGRYEGSFVLDLQRVEVAATLPLRAGARHQEDAALFQVDEVRRAVGLVLRIRRSNARTAFEGRPQRAYSYYFRNRGRREAVMAAVRNPAQESILLPFAAASHVSVDSPSGFAAVQELVMPEQPGRWQMDPSQPPAQTVEVSNEWLADAELMIVRTTESGSVSRALRMEGVRIAVGGSPGGD